MKKIISFISTNTTKNDSKKNQVWTFCLFVFHYLKKRWMCFHWIWKRLVLFAIKHRFPFRCSERFAFFRWWMLRDFLTTVSVGTYFVSSIYCQKHFWVSYSSVDYSLACSHIPIPLSPLFIVEFVLQFLHDFVFFDLFYLYLLCNWFRDIAQKCCFMCCQQWNIIHKSFLFWNTLYDIHLFLSLQ